MNINTQLPFFTVIRVSGDDRHGFLHNQLSNDINHLGENQACYATYNTAKGRVIANLIAHNTGQEIVLILAADVADILLKKLKMFVLRAKVQFEILQDWGVSGSLNTDTPPQIATEPHLILPTNSDGQIVLPHTGCLKIAPLNQLPAHSPEQQTLWQIHEIRSGYPWITAATSETCVAQMLNQHTIGGVHFRKGCYPGQEIIARAQYRGQVKRGLAIATHPNPPECGSEVRTEDGTESGLVLNTAGEWCLLVLKHNTSSQTQYDLSGSPFAVQQLLFNPNPE